MSFVFPTRHKTLLRLLPLFCCWLVLLAGLSQAAMTDEDPAADLSLAQEALENEDPDLAEKTVRNLLSVAAENAPAHRLLGYLLLKKGLHDAAIGEFTTALQIEPQDELAKEYLFSIYYNRAQDLLAIPQEAHKARPELEKAIAIRPDGIMSYYFLGTLNYREKRDEECITALLKVADTIPEKLQSDLHTMLYNCACNLLNQQRAHEAKEVIPYFSLRPQAGISELFLTATIALAIGDFAQSTELYDRVLSRDPLHAMAQHNRGIAQQRLAEEQKHEAAALPQKKQDSPSPPAENLAKPPVTPVTSES